MANSDQIFHLNEAGEQAFGYAQAVKSGSTLHVSGTLSVDETFATLAPGDMRGQLAQVYEMLSKTLLAHDMDFSNVVKETVFITDMDAFIEANGVRLDAYANCAPPACTAVEVARLAFPENMVEIELTAVG